MVLFTKMTRILEKHDFEKKKKEKHDFGMF